MRACKARLSDDDYLFIQRYLNESEQALFFQMAHYDQSHCVEVAKDAVAIGRARGVGPKQLSVLARAALLHDIGKVKGDIGLWDRSLICVLQAMAPAVYERMAEKGKVLGGDGFAYACYVQKYHAARGAHMLQCFGGQQEVAYLIRLHHLGCEDDDDSRVLLDILRKADALN